jgi:hypothetical protein
MAAPFTRARFARAGIDLEALLASALERPPPAIGPDFDRSSLADFNTDLFPKDEYFTSRSFWPGGPRD